MLSRTLKRLGLGALAAATLTVFLPTANASAITNPPCVDPNFVHIWTHTGSLIKKYNDTCFANAGSWTFGLNSKGVCNLWFDRISTGNNAVDYEDSNGTTVHIDMYNDISYPKAPPCIKTLKIL